MLDFFGYQNGIKQGCTRFITGFQKISPILKSPKQCSETLRYI